MKKTAFLILLVTASISGFSQVRRESGNTINDSIITVADANKDKRSKREMMKELNLTRDQRQKLKEAKSSNQSAKAAIENDNTLTADQKKVKLRELRKAQLEKLKTILSPEQIEKLRKMRQENAGEIIE
ncbi:MAG: hypothetical protein V9E88_12060 [Ferruginibacter sp.]